MAGLIGELKRRNVFRVGVAYAIVGWIAVQVVGEVADPLGLPDWTAPLVIVLMGVGFPIALILAWAFEMTPEGVKKTRDVKVEASVTATTGRKLDFAIIGLLVLGLGYFVWERQQPPAAPEAMPATEIAADSTREISIAVLPFADLSPEGDQEYFSDGISEELLNALVRVEGLKVASRTSSFGFKGKNQNIPQIARELGVGHILEGSVRKAGNRVRITAQLIDAGTDRHMWSETYDRELTDIFAIQDEIANAIVTALKGALGMELGLKNGKAVSVVAVTDNMSAYDLYLKARSLFIARSDMPESVRMFEQAVALDPNFARAWEGLAAVQSVMPSWGYSDRDYYAQSAAAADRAIEIDPGLSLAYAVRGSNYGSETPFHWQGIFDNYARAIGNDPQNATARLWRGIALLQLGYLDRAMADFERCVAIDPAYSNCHHHRAITYFIKGEHGPAFAIVKKTREMGFTAIFGGEVHAFVGADRRLTAVVSAMLGYYDKQAPLTEWMDAIENPDGDMTAVIARWDAWYERRGEKLDADLTLLLAFGAYDRIKARTDFGELYTLWNPDFAGFLRTAQFRRLVADMGMVAYWRANGFPPQCRALGADDFECDQEK